MNKESEQVNDLAVEQARPELQGETGGGKPKSGWLSWVKHHQSICGWASLLLAIFVFFVPNWSSIWNSDFDPSAIESKLELRILRHGEPFTKLETLVPLAGADELQIAGRFEIPVYASLLWIDQQGEVELIAGSGDSKTKILQYPETNNDWGTLGENAGTEMILLVASDKPLNELPNKLTKLIAPLVEEHPEDMECALPEFTSAASVWIQPDKTEILNENGESRAMGTTVSHGKVDVITIADKVRDLLREEVRDFRGVVFPHQ